MFNMDSRVTGKTKVVGLIGNPIEHSFSPIIHNSLSSLLGIDLVYVPFNVQRKNLQEAIKGLKGLDVLGFNVTAPYKREVMKFIDDNIRETFLMGSINTVKNIEGRLYGYNTDGEGFLRAFKEESGLKTFKDKKVVLLGAGGVARSIAVKIAVEGVKKISIVNRTASKAAEIAELINDNIKEAVQVYNITDKTFEQEFKDSEIIINATSIGMHPNVNVSLLDDHNYFIKGQIVFDSVYSPIKTKFLKQAEEKESKSINGLKMLFYQAISAYEIWTGIKLPKEFLEEFFDNFKVLVSNK